MLGHPIKVRSLHGKGSVFSIEVPLTPGGAASSPDHRPRGADDASAQTTPRTGTILIIEDDPEVREHLELFLGEEGYNTVTAIDGPAALELAARRTIRPDLVLADYNLPNGMNGIEISEKLRQELNRQIPFIILTGDISTQALRDIALHDCVQFNKPVKLRALMQAIENLLAKPPAAPAPRPFTRPKRQAPPDAPRSSSSTTTTTFARRYASCWRTTAASSKSYSSCEAFLAAYRPDKSACLLIDAYLPGMSGLELLRKLHDDGHRLPAIMITGNSDVSIAVEAMKAGALDFIEKPIGREELIASIERALEMSQELGQVAGMAGIGGDSPRGSHAATARGDGKGARRPPQQEHRGRPRHQPTHRREPSRIDHEENRIEVASGAGPIGARRGGRRRRAATSAVRTAAAGSGGSSAWFLMREIVSKGLAGSLFARRGQPSVFSR